jgi:hypothetical protein
MTPAQQVADIMKEASMFRLDLVFAAVVFSIGSVIFLCIALFVVTLAKLFLTFVIAVGPLFILCLAWRPTARFFDSWLSMVLNAVVLTWFAFFALGLSAYMGAGHVQGHPDGGGFLGPTFNVLGESHALLRLMILMAIICFQAPSLASALTGGAAVQQGIQMIQNAMMVSGLRSASSARGAGAAVPPVVSCAPVPACRMRRARPRAPPPRPLVEQQEPWPPVPAPWFARVTARCEPPPTSSPRCAAGRSHFNQRQPARSKPCKLVSRSLPAVLVRSLGARWRPRAGHPGHRCCQPDPDDPAGAERWHHEINNQVQQITQLQEPAQQHQRHPQPGQRLQQPDAEELRAGRGLHLPQRDQHVGVLGPERHGQGAARRGHGLQLHGPGRRCPHQPARPRWRSRTSRRACCRTR